MGSLFNGIFFVVFMYAVAVMNP